MKAKDFQGRILILDYGSQYTQLIARRVREYHVYCEIHPFNMSLEAIRDFQPKGIILSGGPSSVYENDAPLNPPEIFRMGIPTLGICYGMQLMTHVLGGKVGPIRQTGIRPERALHRQYPGSFCRAEPGSSHSSLDEPWRQDRSPSPGFSGHRSLDQLAGGGHEE